MRISLHPLIIASTFSNNSASFTILVSYFIIPQTSFSSNIFISLMIDIAMFTSGFSFKTIDMIPQISIFTVDCGSSVTMLARA